MSPEAVEEGGEELVGQPSAFDVLSFGETCRLTSVTRYRYRNVIEGRPAYDDVSLLNGTRIDTVTDPGRTCERPERGDLTLRQVGAQRPATDSAGAD